MLGVLCCWFSFVVFSFLCFSFLCFLWFCGLPWLFFGLVCSSFWRLSVLAVLGLLAFVLGFVLAAGSAVFVAAGVVSFWVWGFPFSFSS